MKNKLLLIDGNSLAHRAFYATQNLQTGILRNTQGQAVNAVLTFFKMIIKSIEDYKPTHIFIAFDAGKKTFRHAKFQEYKKNRSKTPEDLISQFHILKTMIKFMNINYYQKIEIEADDIIASMVQKLKHKFDILILSSDHDLLQLIDTNVYMIMQKKSINKMISYDNFFDIFGYNVKQALDFKGIVGDPSDNLPGIKGIGKIGAVKLLGKYKTLENIYKNIDNIQGQIKNKLIEFKKEAFLSKDIATLLLDLEIPFSDQDILIKNYINKNLINFFKKYELNSLLIKYTKILENKNKNKNDFFKKIIF